MSKPKEILYHYCPAESFVSILTDCTMRMGKITAMNDFMDYSWLKYVALMRISELLYAVNHFGSKPRKYGYYFLQEARNVLNSRKTDIPYCTCFSTDGDVLSQWRAYANDAQGFAIGFNKELLQKIPFTKLVQIKYDGEEHLKIVDDLVTHYQSRIADQATTERVIEYADEFFKRAAESFVVCKNPAFSEKKEWRIVHAPGSLENTDGNEDCFGRSDKPVYRILNGRILRFLEFTFDKKAVVDLVVGPKNPATVDDDGLQEFLLDKGFLNIKPRKSNATYR